MNWKILYTKVVTYSALIPYQLVCVYHNSNHSTFVPDCEKQSLFNPPSKERIQKHFKIIYPFLSFVTLFLMMYFGVHSQSHWNRLLLGTSFHICPQCTSSPLYTDVLWPCFLYSSVGFTLWPSSFADSKCPFIYFIYSLKKCNWAPYCTPESLKVIRNQQWIQRLAIKKPKIIVLNNFWDRGDPNPTFLTSLTFHALSSFTDNLITYRIRSFQGTFHPEYFLIWLMNLNKLVKILKGDSPRNCVMIDGKKMAL